MEHMSAVSEAILRDRELPSARDFTTRSVEGLLGASAIRHVLYLLEGQYLYQTREEDGSLRYKFLSADTVRLAFSREAVDSGWLSPEICRWGYGQNGQWSVMFIPPARRTIWIPSPFPRSVDRTTTTGTATTTVPTPTPVPTTGDAPTGNSPGAAAGEEEETATNVAAEGRSEPDRGGRVETRVRVEGTPTQPGWGQRTEQGLVALEVPLPGLVFAGAGLHYFVWAVKAKSFDPDLPAYNAPFPNVYLDGRICFGNNRVGPATTQRLKETWQLFLAAPFNTDMVQGKSRRYPRNVLSQLCSLTTAAGRKTYPVRDLVPIASTSSGGGSPQTVNQLVKRLVEAAGMNLNR